MKSECVFNLQPSRENKRNSEGSFLRLPGGDLLFAYSSFMGGGNDDNQCNIAMVRSSDEGKSWSDPEIIVRAAEFETNNLMSVSALPLLDGTACFYFIIKEKDGSTTIGRTITKDGISFQSEKCGFDCSNNYYVINNDRFVRAKDGRIVVPSALHSMRKDHEGRYHRMEPGRVCCFVSGDDGKNFSITHTYAALDVSVNKATGLQEPGMMELENGDFWIWARTDLGCQYQIFSDSTLTRFSAPEPSAFTSPCSPMQVRRFDDTVYAVYNPIPNYNGRNAPGYTGGRTPLVIRKSEDGGKTFGPLNVLGGDPGQGYCYPSLFVTRDNHLLVSYCYGIPGDSFCLSRLSILRISVHDIE